MAPFSLPDVIIFICYFLAGLFLLKVSYASRNNKRDEKLYTQAFIAKAAFTIIYCSIIKFVYGSGDSFLYFRFAQSVNNLPGNSLLNTLDFIRTSDISEIVTGSTSDNYLNSPRTLFMVKVTALLNLFSFQSFLVTSWFYSLYALAGTWLAFKSLNQYLHTHLNTFLAILLFFFPSYGIWTSGILKDTLIAGSLGFYLYAFINILNGKGSKYKNLFVILISLWIILQIKSYVAYALIGSMAFFYLTKLTGRIKNVLVKFFVLGTFLTLVAGLVMIFRSQLMAVFNKFVVENLLEDALRQYERLDQATQRRQLDNSSYSLGFDLFTTTLTPAIVIQLIPNAIITTLYRPFMWEAHKVLQYFSALENLFGFFLTGWFIFKTGFFRFWRILFRNPFFVYLLVFVLVFAFFIGISSGNFGTLSRYRTPCIAIFYILLYMVYYRGQEMKKSNSFK